MKETVTDSPESNSLLDNARLVSPAAPQPSPVSPGRQQRIVLIACVSAVILALAVYPQLVLHRSEASVRESVARTQPVTAAVRAKDPRSGLSAAVPRPAAVGASGE